MKLSYTERARHDLTLAVDWYEAQQRGLGFEFLECIEHAIRLIVLTPQIYQISHLNFRACHIKRFPFAIFYTIEPAELVIHAVFPSRMNPARRPR